ncbi:MAG: glycerophosphodiester phosphodiesterase [Pseudomonadota bacterium]
MSDTWRYPRWIAHRGAGKLAPENTMAAFRLGAQHGFRMFECDVKLSADGVPFLLHDTTLERTTNGRGKAGALAWGALAQLDAGSWHSRAHAGEPLATFENLARYCLRNGFYLNIEIKPSPGTERLTGETVAALAARLWQGVEVPPLLTSFQPEALVGARAAAPGLPRGLLLEALRSGWLEEALALGCVAVVANYNHWSADTVAQAHGAGLRALSYTVNDAWAAEWLAGLGMDGIITDRIDRFAPA